MKGVNQEMKLEKGKIYTWGEVCEQLKDEKTTLAVSPLTVWGGAFMPAGIYFNTKVIVSDIIDLPPNSCVHCFCQSVPNCISKTRRIVFFEVNN